jgi:hypothetical protein
MKKITVTLALISALAVPAAAAAKPDHSDRRAAHKECKQLRGKTRATREGFRATYHSMSRCVRQKAAEEEAERKEARDNAAQECKAERKSLGPDDFAEKYGENRNGKNAFGKCVSTRAKQHKDEMDDEDRADAVEHRNAAKRCAAERGEIGRDDFAEKYGGNHNDRNAFGKCVSRRTHDS